MARLCSFPSPPTSLSLKSAAALNPLRRILMLSPRTLSLNSTLTLQITSSIKNTVFEDNSKGVICYIDDQGELVCEGFDDEEPRFHQDFEKTPTYPRSEEEFKIDLLPQKTWVPMVEAKEHNGAAVAAAGRGDLRVNGFTSSV